MNLKAVAILIASLVLGAPAKAEQSPLMGYLMHESATMYDIGMIRMQQFFDMNLDEDTYRITFPDLIAILPQIRFDIDQSRFDVDIVILCKSTMEVEFMRMLILVIFQSLTPSNEISLNYFFRHQGWSNVAMRTAEARYDFSEIDKSTYINVSVQKFGANPPEAVTAHWNYAKHQIVFQ